MPRLAVITTHPVQYYAPLFRELAGRVDLMVYYAHQPSAQQQAAAGFGTAFEWDVDLLSGYAHEFLPNVAKVPDAGTYAGCDTPAISDNFRSGQFDGVLSLGWHVKSLQQGIWAAKRMGLPVMIRGDSQLGMQTNCVKLVAKRLLYPGLLRVFDAALAVGQRNKAFFCHYKYPEKRIFMSPHAVDTRAFADGASADARARTRTELGIGADVPLVLFAGKLVAFKRPGDVVAALGALRRSGLKAEMMIAGSGPLEGALREQARTLDLPLHELGFVNQSRMPAVYAAADILALPSTGRETWGLVANEALACGTPVVLSDAAGSAADLGDGMAGLVFPCGDVHALAEGLTRMLTAPPDARVIADLSSRFGLDKAADGVCAAFDFVADRRKRQGSV